MDLVTPVYTVGYGCGGGSVASRDRINVVLPPKAKAAVERLAKKDNRSASGWLRLKTLEWLREAGEDIEDDETSSKEAE